MGWCYEQHPREGERDRAERGDLHMTVLEDLWYGNIAPHGTVLNDDRRFRNILALMGRNRDKLSATLTEQQKETLAKVR